VIALGIQRGEFVAQNCQVTAATNKEPKVMEAYLAERGEPQL
jgi:hypothetical protein